MARRGSLSGRILALALGLVVATTLAAGLATVQFARSAARAEQRSELAAQASLLGLRPGRVLTPAALARVSGELDGTVVDVVGPGGAIVASTAQAGRAGTRRLTPLAARAVAGEAVSEQILIAGRRVLVEARPTADGGAVVLSRRLQPLTRSGGGLVGGILAVLVAGLVVATVAAVTLSRRIARPLGETAAAARRLARGDRDVALPADGPAEVVDVAAALHALDTALATSEGRQREFLLSVSHEIRTPLTAIRGYGEALADGVVTGHRLREAGTVLLGETARLERFTADLLELARLEADDFSITPSDVDLTAVAAATVEAWRARAASLDVALALDLDLDSPAGPLRCRADERRVRQVLDGLVENALRATPVGGTVRLVTEIGASTVGVAVEDSGPGLSDEDLTQAFTRGLLRERYRETRAVGTGLGLSIAARLADRMDGRVAAEHAREPPGARFLLELPRA